MRKIIILISCLSLLSACNSKKLEKDNKEEPQEHSNQVLITEFETAANRDLLQQW